MINKLFRIYAQKTHSVYKYFAQSRLRNYAAGITKARKEALLLVLGKKTPRQAERFAHIFQNSGISSRVMTLSLL